MIMVHVTLHTILQRETPEGLKRRLDVHLPERSTVLELMSYLQINLEPEQILLVVNGRLVGESHYLNEGDQVSLMPALSGG